MGFDQLRSWGPLIARIAAGLFGGYAIAALVSITALTLPISRSEAIFAGTTISFAAYAVAVIWVFAARSARRAWIGLLVVALPLIFVWGAMP